VLAVALAACRGDAATDFDAAVGETARSEAPSAGRAAPPPAPPGAAPVASTPAQAPDSAGLKIIRTATLRLRVDDYAAARAAVDTALQRFDAYVASENATRGYGGLEGQLVVRVAARQFAALVDRLVGLAEEVDYREVTAEDVTEQYVDAEARLRAKRAVEQRYLELLARAQTVDDILAVENNLRVIREEVESMEGRLRYLQNRVGYSTVHLALYEGRPGGSPTRPFGTRLADAFAEGWEGFQGLVVGLVQLWPLWLLLFGVGLPLRHWWRARRRAAPKPGPQHPGA